MSPVVAPPPTVERTLPPLARAAPVEPRRRLGTVPLFLGAFAGYAGLGLYTTLRLHVVVGDAESRLAHAFFVWWNAPRKLSAIGFVWPPLQTLALVPLAAVRPLATSLAALPLTSALFGAGLVVVLERALADAGVARLPRAVAVAAVALNPIVVFYAANGMAEIEYLFLLATAFWLLLRFARRPSWQLPALIGAIAALGVLARYELVLWVPLLAAGVVIALVERRQTAAVEAHVLTLLAPVVHAVLLWTFLNWAIVGRPLGYIHAQFPGAALRGQPGFGALPGGLATAWIVLKLYLLEFAPVLPLAVVLVWWAVTRRRPLGAVLALALLVNAFTTLGLALRSELPVLLQLRYNLRAIPLVVIAIAWLASEVRGRERRRVAAAGAAALVLTLPLSTLAVLHPVDGAIRDAYGLGESAFVRGLLTGRDQQRRGGPAGTGLAYGAQLEMARWIRDHVRGRDAVLTDDARTYGVILRDGHPDRYFDRTDRGDAAWLRVVRHPVGRVRYILVEREALRARDVVFFDRIVAEHPGLGAGQQPPGFATLAHAVGPYAIYRVRGRRG